MTDKKTDGVKPDHDAAKAAAGKDEDAKGGAGAVIQAWLPLLVTIVLMPVLAFATTKFLILPKVVQAREGAAEAAEREDARTESKHDGAKELKEARESKENKEARESGGKGHGKKKQTVPISKVIVNVAGSMGTRYLMTSFTLVSTQNDFKTTVEENKDQLLDLANTAMASKSISDLEKPGARNQLRSELMSIFNNALGANVVQEIYFTEFAVQ
jgi:flagellar FliL protein